MGTKTVDEAGAETGAEAPRRRATRRRWTSPRSDAKDEARRSPRTPTAWTTDARGRRAVEARSSRRAGPAGVGQGAGAVVSAALGLVSLTGGWIGTVAAAREDLVGQLETASTRASPHQIQDVYGDAWQATALWAGLFALAALVIGVVVLARPAFGAPGRLQAPWIKSVAWAGVTLGVIGLLLAVLKYTDALLGLPSAQLSRRRSRGVLGRP